MSFDPFPDRLNTAIYNDKLAPTRNAYKTRRRDVDRGSDVAGAQK